MSAPRTTAIRRTATAAWLALLTAAWLATFGVGVGAAESEVVDDGVEVLPVEVLGPILTIPVDSVVRGPAGSTESVALASVPAEYVGSECVIRVEGENQHSVHPGNDLLVTTGGVTVVVADFEGEANASRAATGAIPSLGETVAVSVRFGDDEVSSGGVTVTIEQCVLPAQPTPVPTPPPTTSSTTTEPTSTTASTTAPSTTEPLSPSTVAPTTQPEVASPSTSVEVAAPTTIPVATTTPTTTAAPTTGVATSSTDVTVLAGTPTTGAVEVLGIQQLPETGAAETAALLGLTLVTLGWLLVSWSRRFAPTV